MCIKREVSKVKRCKWYLGLIVVALVTLIVANVSCVNIVVTDEAAQPSQSSQSSQPSQPSQPSGFSTYTDAQNGFSIAYPKDWEKIPQTLLGGVEMVVGGGTKSILVGFWALAKTEHDFTPNFTIAKAEMPYEVDLDAEYGAMKADSEQEKGYAFIAEDYMTIDGIQAIKYVYRSSEVTDSTQMFMLLAQGKVVWFITLSCAPQSFNSLEPTFDAIAGSLRTSGSPATASSTQLSTTPSGFQTYTDSVNGFSISYPKNWEKLPQELMTGDSIAGFRTPEGTGTSRAMVLLQNFSVSSGATLQSEYEDFKLVAESFPGYLFISKDDIIVAGIPAVRHVYQRSYPGGDATETHIYFIRGNVGWLFSLACTPPQSYAQHKPTFDAIIGSFKILNN